MIKRVDHIGIAVKNTEQVLAALSKVVDTSHVHSEVIADQGVKGTIIPIGDGEIELLEPVSPTSAIAKFLESRGEGLHHIALEVDDVNKELQNMAAKGVQLVDKAGRPGLAGLIGFLHPRSTGGVLIELCQKAKK